MEKLITGIHHVTVMASDAQQNIDFYTGILGLRLVKKTVNFDNQRVYHFYYGDELGRPGSILTFFPYAGLVKGRQGNGFVNTTSFSLPYSSLDYWIMRLKKFNIHYKEPQERFQKEVVVYFEDPDGLGLELVFNEQDPRAGFTYGHIPLENAIKGFYHVELWLDGYERTAALLTEVMDHELISEGGNRFRFAANPSPGNFVDIICSPESPQGRAGSGAVHHVAFKTPDHESQTEVREKIRNYMLNPTPIMDRQYFKSIYFNEPGGVLFEVATTDDSFTNDEEKEDLGNTLKLPPWFEKDRVRIEKGLPVIEINIEKFQ